MSVSINEGMLDAVTFNDISLLKQDIANGCDVNYRNSLGSTALHIAASNGYTGSMILLIENGAAVDSLDNLKKMPLHEAAEQNKVEAIEILLKNGAAIDAKSNGGYTPLITAATLGHLSAVKALAEAGADVLITDDNQRTALDWAMKDAVEEEIDDCPVVAFLSSIINAIDEQNHLNDLINIEEPKPTLDF